MNDRYAYDRWIEREPDESLYEDAPESEEQQEEETMDEMSEEEVRGLVRALRALGINARAWAYTGNAVIIDGTGGVKYHITSPEHVRQYVEEVQEKLDGYLKALTRTA